MPEKDNRLASTQDKPQENHKYSEQTMDGLLFPLPAVYRHASPNKTKDAFGIKNVIQNEHVVGDFGPLQMFALQTVVWHLCCYLPLSRNSAHGHSFLGC